jgi:hypothetical protein
MMSALPAALAMSMKPVSLTPTCTSVDVVLPARTLMFDVPGWLVPSGHTVTKVVALALTTVRLSTTAVAPVGMLPPVTSQTSVSCVGDKCSDVVVRLSSARTGVIGVNALCTVACTIHDWDTASVSGTATANPMAHRRWRAFVIPFLLSPIDRLHVESATPRCRILCASAKNVKFDLVFAHANFRA